MKSAGLTIIPAGAGSGKTHTLQQWLADRVADGRVAPDRILAVTFTEAAAGELRGRIRGELIRRGLVEHAQRLDLSPITTIHGFGLRVLQEFAFAGGSSPSPRLLDDAEQSLLIRLGLAATDRLDLLARDPARFGYTYEHGRERTAEDCLRDALLNLMGLLRTLGPRGVSPELVEQAERRLREGYGPTLPAETLHRDLTVAAEALLARFPSSLARNFEGNASASRDFTNDFRALHRIMAPEGKSDWAAWRQLQAMRLTKRGAPTPAGYDDLAGAVMRAAGQLPRHPGPLADACLHARALLEAGREVLGHYAAGKRRDCLVDYPDMISGAWELLASHAEVRRHLGKRLDCMVIDEFQDTNPMQFALLWQLHREGVPAVVVGDLKQAIMGFQHADPRLFAALAARYPASCTPLTANWRSSAPLLSWINAVAGTLFPGYSPLESKVAYSSSMEPLEVVVAEKGIRADADRASWTAQRIAALLTDPASQVWDRRLGNHRRLLGGDIAVLCPTHALIAKHAQALREQGVRVRVEGAGWLASPVVQLACQALAWVADGHDRHAALALAVTELGIHSLAGALATLVRGESLADPVLDALAALRPECAAVPASEALAKVIGTLDLYGLVATWPEADQSRADLVRLQGEAADFADADPRVLSAAGIHGRGIQAFLAWVTARAGEDDQRPSARIVDEESVTVTTWHSAKGLEWPVVAVCGLHHPVKPRLPSLGIEWASLECLDELPAQGEIAIVPKFACAEIDERFRPPLQQSCEEEARRLLYVALTRAREKVILEWPAHLAGKSEQATLWSLLAGDGGIALEDGQMTAGGKSFPCVVSKAGPGAAPPLAGVAGSPAEMLPVFGRRALCRREVPAGLTPESIAPSSLRAENTESIECAGLVHRQVADPLALELPLSPLERGTLLHRSFELLERGREGSVLLSMAFPGMLTPPQVEAIVKAQSAFAAWLAQTLAPVSVRREVPVLGLDPKGSVVSGKIDLLVETAQGFWVFDYKSDVVDDLDLRFATYRPQLECYADLLRQARPAKPVLGIAIYWITRGQASLWALGA